MNDDYTYSFDGEDRADIETKSQKHCRAPQDGDRLTTTRVEGGFESTSFSLHVMPNGTVHVMSLAAAHHARERPVAKFDVSQLEDNQLFDQAIDTVSPETRYYTVLDRLQSDYQTRFANLDLQADSEQRDNVDHIEIPDQYQLRDPAQLAVERKNTSAQYSDQLTNDEAVAIADTLQELSPGDRVSFGSGIRPHTIVDVQMQQTETFDGNTEYFGSLFFCPPDADSDPSQGQSDGEQRAYEWMFNELRLESSVDPDDIDTYAAQNPDNSNVIRIDVSVSTDSNNTTFGTLSLKSSSTTAYGNQRELGLITDVTLKEPGDSSEYPDADYTAEIEWLCDPDPARV